MLCLSISVVDPRNLHSFNCLFSLSVSPLVARLNEPAPQFNSLKSTSPTGLILCDWDISLRREGSEKPPFRLNCIRDYGLGDNSRVALIMCQHRRPKTVPTSPASMRSSSICMFKGNTRLPPVHNLISNDSQTCSPEQTVLSDTVPLTGQLDTLEAGQKSNLSQSLPLYPVCSPVKTDGTESANTMYSVYCVRPTGSPDPTIWYHLELSKSVNTEGGPCLGPYANGGRLGSGTGVGGSGLVIHEPPSMSVVDYNSGESPPCTYVDDVCQVHSKCGPVRKSHWRGTWRFIRKDSTQTAGHSRPDRLEAVTNAAVSHPLLSAESSCLAGSSTLGLQHNSGCGHICAPPTKHRDRVKRKRKNDSIFSTRGDRIKQTSASLDRLMDSLPKEVFFNRLMVTRLSVTCYMEKLFEVIFSSVLQSHSLPSPIKYLFDFLDAQAASLGVEDPKTVHAWKSNCLQMRFWNQIITNLDYIFDIPLLRHTAFERSFHALSQAMTYACAPTKEKLTPDSSSVKLLFARDISQQWARVNNYYREIKAMPAIKREDMKEILHQHSLVHANDFNVSWAIYELYTKYVKPCHNVLVARLQQEALKAPITYKSQHSFDLKTIPNTPGVSQVDEVEFSDYNPIQLIQVLIEVEQCMDSAQSSTLPVRNAHSMNRPRQPGDICPPIPSCQTSVHPGGQSPCFFTSGPASPSAFLSTVASGGDTTDYPDTLRSLNTLTTEFAGDDTSRLQPAAQHIHHYHHCYHLYNPDGSTVGGHPASEPLSPSLEATVHGNRYAPTDPVV
ncbi:hypothetical protein EG68_03089 [Paragonimus skrjabini miyazakii]|uniref:Plexin cytoplasmic RasGAP domain-containing protein n=1 Tax=Paragonimus skrjabini miyazakii TaxID=59628 RepID=A0A8S9Z350_9TREM|nr:hypothetical protein EG68_03089 [Paragonimus skrjabini miyazakii]